MGFDLYGNGLEGGEYFRNNCWWWRRLADFCLDHVKLPPTQTKYWHSNDGQKVSKASALKIAKFLRLALRKKELYQKWIKESEEKYIYKGECSHPFDWENVENFAKFCEESEGFQIC